jgi:hypothetical protein
LDLGVDAALKSDPAPGDLLDRLADLARDVEELQARAWHQGRRPD